MNTKTQMLILAGGFLGMGLWVSLSTLNALLLLNEPAPFPPVSTILAVVGILLAYWSDKK